ncbi:MAG TPA: MoxR family ATPase, partial [Acidimicrobiia bacterium]|nr:MoxR family ATPase [Acidimicrobiia bacterium]
MNAESFASRAGAVIAEVEKAIVGKRSTIELVLAAALADGHVLIDDLPGLGKTLLVRSLAAATGLEQARIQFTPDLMPMDITGS